MSIIFAILLFSFLVFIHELGHFVAAKWSGVRVNEFSLFMGPALWQKQVGETLYAIRCIPVGGYCAMEGEDEDTPDDRSFQKAPWWKRFIILVAGSFMNLVTGVLIFCIVFLPAQQVLEPAIESFTDCALINGEGGLQVGDLILQIDDEPVYVYGDVNTLLSVSTKENHDVVVLRNGEKVTIPNALVPHEHTDENGETYSHYGFSYGRVRQLDLADRFDYVWRNSINTVRNVRLSLQMMVSGQAGLKDMSGPVGIVSMMNDVAESAEDGFTAMMNLLYFGGFIAINLGVMNLLPIPALDGGRVVCLMLSTVYEKLTRKKPDPRIEGYLHGAGMIVLLALMALIMFKDIFVIVTG